MKQQYSEFYKSVTGFFPYGYQVKVGEALLSGKNVILSVPTGAGKTWASIIPFLYARQELDVDFPQKMIYSLPLRTLANSIHNDIDEILRQHKSFDKISSIHTGEYKDDEYFESDIIFSTIDQTLSNFLSFPLSLSKRQANINAGALIGSFLIFDEFHLLDPKLSMSTTLGMLKALGTLCRFCIMTATLSSKYIKELENELGTVTIKIEDYPKDVEKIGSLKPPSGKYTKKTLTTIESTIDAKTILEHHKHKTIVICNRVEKAQKIYHDIINILPETLNKESIICLHSRFFDKDRKKKEKDIKRLFGKNSKANSILISTQVIEAGMDISCDKMHVEISPINSFLQRAGRCARWEDEFGEIYIYDVLELDEHDQLNIETSNKEELLQIKAINNKYLPYDKLLCEASMAQLINANCLDTKSSQYIVDEILTKEELKDFSRSRQCDFNKNKIQKSWEDCNKNMYSSTIRNIDNIEIAIIDWEREKNRNFNPYLYETIGLYKWTFIKWVKDIFSGRDFDDDDDVIFIAEKNSESQFVDFDTNDKDGFALKAIRDITNLKNYYDIVFVDKSIFKYTSDAGLELGKGISCSPFKSFDKKQREDIVYHKDTFVQHNKALIACYEQEFKPKLNFTFNQLNKYWGEAVNWDMLIKAMICLHDYGKLNYCWQKPMKRLQELKANGNYFPEEVLAHTDFDEKIDKHIEQQSGANKKPPHAGIGAIVLYRSFGEIINEDLAKPVSTAILKHHGVETESYPNFEIRKLDYSQIEFLLSEIGINISLDRNSREGKILDSLPENIGEWIIYFFLVRILRISDQRATMNINKYLIQ